MKISIIVPAYNEEKTVSEILQKLLKVNFGSWQKEIIVFNDCSTDGTEKILEKFKNEKLIKIFKHEKNLGKGAAVIDGIAKASGDYVVIQDADLEYDPNDIYKMLKVVEGNEGVVVYGSRLTLPPVLTGKNKTPLLLHYFGNKLLSLITSLLYGTWLTDMETCYKLFPRHAATKIKLVSRGFEFEPEITAKLLKAGLKIVEVPISTKPRGYEEGKKLNTWKDGWRAMKALLKYRVVN